MFKDKCLKLFFKLLIKWLRLILYDVEKKNLQATIRNNNSLLLVFIGMFEIRLKFVNLFISIVQIIKAFCLLEKVV